MKPTVFSSGSGRLTADILNSYQRATNEVDQLYNPFEKPAYAGPYLMQVTASEQMQTTDDPPVDIPNRWLYSLVSIQINDIRDPSTWDTQSLTTDGAYAMNMVEAPNTDTKAMGIEIDSLPEGWALQPIPEDTLVWAYFTPESGDPGFQCVFSASNQFDGEC